MDQNSKDSLVVWAGTMLGGAAGWLASSRVAAAYAYPLGTWGKVAAGLLGAVAGTALTKMVLSDQGAMPQIEADET
jgi:uncharacterized membrane protein YeaQ/YmgE (transglycosylase-associated protein family)